MSNILEVAPILSIYCDEPEGRILRQVRPLIMDMENLTKFYEKAKQFPTLFAHLGSNDFGSFCEVFLSYKSDGSLTSNGLFWVVDDFVGIFYLTDIYAPHEATVHYTFFDKRLRGRKELAKKMLEFAFTKYRFNRLNASLPLYAGAANFAFVRSIGFKTEGRKRSCKEYAGKYFDESLFGILKSEVIQK